MARYRWPAAPVGGYHERPDSRGGQGRLCGGVEAVLAAVDPLPTRDVTTGNKSPTMSTDPLHSIIMKGERECRGGERKAGDEDLVEGSASRIRVEVAVVAAAPTLLLVSMGPTDETNL